MKSPPNIFLNLVEIFFRVIVLGLIIATSVFVAIFARARDDESEGGPEPMTALLILSFVLNILSMLLGLLCQLHGIDRRIHCVRGFLDIIPAVGLGVWAMFVVTFTGSETDGSRMARCGNLDYIACPPPPLTKDEKLEILSVKFGLGLVGAHVLVLLVTWSSICCLPSPRETLLRKKEQSQNSDIDLQS